MDVESRKQSDGVRTELLRLNGAVEEDPAIDAWMKSKRVALRLAQQHVNVFGHDHIGEHAQSVSTPDLFQRGDKDVLRLG